MIKVRSLLVADDDMDDLMILHSVIDTCYEDVTISHVKDGVELFAFLQPETKPDLIFLDINMPKIDGIDCLKRIRSNKNFNDIPIIMYSTSSNSVLIDKCFQFGASRYLIKPFSYEDIVKFMKIILTFDWNANKVILKEDFLLSGK